MIKINMQMPEKCGLCPCFHHENPMYCQAVKADKNKKIVNPYGSPRPEWCPLKEQEPKEVKDKSKRIKFLDEYFEGECPSCRSFIDEHSNRNFCGYCGQAVKWDT